MESPTWISHKPTAAKIRVWLGKAPLLGRNEEAWKCQPDYQKQELIQPYDGCVSGEQREEQVEKAGAEAEEAGRPLSSQNAPSAPAAEERAEPPHRSADVSSAPSSAAEPSDPWCSPTFHPRSPSLAETFCQAWYGRGPQSADGQEASAVSNMILS
ncbi:hypothetical protein AMECASPLE_029019 [Ameca splendens]|uniref:Uncharacterized protein n=1 Tax=Ameca splendens TaxID=208324 RepID=A0ABV0Y5G0_9TELE